MEIIGSGRGRSGTPLQRRSRADQQLEGLSLDYKKGSQSERIATLFRVASRRKYSTYFDLESAFASQEFYDGARFRLLDTDGYHRNGILFE